jgi:DNA-binding response OmpR family regulator
MRALYVGTRHDSALVKALAEIGCKVDEVDPASAGWALAENPYYAIIVYEQPERQISDFAMCVGAKPVNAMMLVIPQDNRAQTRTALLKAGADRCMARPLSFVELEALLHAHLRRHLSDHSRRHGIVVDVRSADRSGSGLMVDVQARRVTAGERLLSLTSSEYRLLALLADADGKTVDRPFIWQQLWGDTAEMSSTAVDAAVWRLRRKLAQSPAEIVTVRGIGYRLSGRFRISTSAGPT